MPASHLRVRLKDIAARAKVSIMTVSKVMRDEPDISNSTKTRVRDIARQMGYVPNSAAASLRNSRSGLVGVVLPSSAHQFWARVLAGIEENAHAQGYDLLVGHSNHQAEREEAVIQRFFARRVDGFLIAPVYRLAAYAPIFQFLTRQTIPAVILGQRALFCAEFPSVETEDIQAGFAATRHLIELGHRRIAFFTGPVVSPQSQERYEGYRRALREAGILVEDKLLYSAGVSVEDGESAALQFLHESCDATAVLAVNDFVAVGVMSTFEKQGVRVPGQISVVGFGNLFLGDKLPVPLTTIHQPKMSLGASAIEMLLKRIEGGNVVQKRLPCELIIRSSTAAPRLDA